MDYTNDCKVKDKGILLSIIIPVYNHEKYIKQCVNSVLSQNIDFEYDVWIGDDCSLDASRLIVKESQKDCPSNFHFIYRDKNIHPNNAIDLINKSTGKYVAVLEGDDFWLYNEKIKTQIQYMEKNPNCIATYHNCLIVDEESRQNGEKYKLYSKEFYDIKAYKKGFLPGQTGTGVLRREYYKLNEYFNNNYKLYNFFPGDRKMAFLLLFAGKVKIFDDQWGAYRHVTKSGSSFSATRKKTSETRKDEVLFYKSLKNFAEDKGNRKLYNICANRYYSVFFTKCIGKNKIFELKDYWNELIKEKNFVLYFANSIKRLILFFKTINKKR